MGEAQAADEAPMGVRPTDRARVPIRWFRIVSALPVFLFFPVLLALFLRITAFEAYEMGGPSMEPTLRNGDRFVIDKTAFGLWLPGTNEAMRHWGTPKPGDVVVFRMPIDEIDVVKRVVGLPGDVIEIRNDEVWRNGAPLPTEQAETCSGVCADYELCACLRETLGGVTYTTMHSPSSPPLNRAPLTVPSGHVYVVGDRRDRSNDSRIFGPVSARRVKGRALVIYWSEVKSRIGRWLR